MMENDTNTKQIILYEHGTEHAVAERGEFYTAVETFDSAKAAEDYQDALVEAHEAYGAVRGEFDPDDLKASEFETQFDIGGKVKAEELEAAVRDLVQVGGRNSVPKEMRSEIDDNAPTIRKKQRVERDDKKEWRDNHFKTMELATAKVEEVYYDALLKARHFVDPKEGESATELREREDQFMVDYMLAAIKGETHLHGKPLESYGFPDVYDFDKVNVSFYTLGYRLHSKYREGMIMMGSRNKVQVPMNDSDD